MDNNKKLVKYTPKDSVFLFLFILLIPQIFSAIVYAFVCSICLKYGMTADEISMSPAVLYIQYFSIYLAFACIYFIYNKVRKIDCFKASNLSFKKINILQVVIVLVIGLICLFGLNPISNMFQFGLEKIGYKTAGGADFFLSSPLNFVIVEFLVAFLPAVFEELTLRGVVFHGFKNGYSDKKSVLFSAILFMIMHLSLAQSVYQLFMGIVLALVVLYTGNLFYSMILHFVNNFIIILSGYLTYGQPTETVTYTTFMDYFLPIVLAVVSVALIVGLLYLLRKITKYSKNKQVESTNQDISQEKDISQNQETNEELIEQDVVNRQETNNQKNDNKLVKICFIVCAVIWFLAVLMGFME